MTAERILVTGGAGFIGSHLVEALLESGYSVRVLDNLSSGKLSNLPVDRCHLTLVVGDVADAPTVERAMKDCSAVVHLAAVASVQASVDDPVATHQSNFVGTLNICEAMRQAGVRRVVYASSAAIYGNNGEGMAITEDTPKNPLTPYAADKLAGEHFLDFYRRQHGLESVILRFFNIYGPRQDPSSPYSGVISIFSERAQKKLPITVYGDGEQTRDFVYVNDLVKVLVQAVSQSEPINEPVNVGFNRSTSVNELAATLSELLGRSLTLNYDTPRSGDIKHSRADNSRLLERFSLRSPTCFSEGLGQLLRSIDSGGR
ncbi:MULTISPECIES: NAD-dependent epimerase/dehydratase family protein [unclassified Pseudomonas]|uniref:NAD-dependent epimerase/dehydratase family protein n=1 Tax=unclassified Pseudomonas TaxID=196821 RepID=UPI000C8782AD|nr:MULTISPECIES: NAD-dependent epimerase/dehydratase family protein [unclassified Pseudomonas]PMU08026.1 NAD-dependent dehydratase [Pseudomonas sp. FW305-20]PMU15498.1 NAD-dependent dehydratase [Pseudomonas sp. FW305-122]PMU40680.1 NAD-dependent dehydratase [Pseudomonas sp. FW305-47B]PMX57344.1 NAD-dependent dehydratase [Pseudomonas sp. FW305-33]PMX62005.1 NAD-dependent dehydratase [Pseudomonas sp. FW305-60]